MRALSTKPAPLRETLAKATACGIPEPGRGRGWDGGGGQAASFNHEVWAGLPPQIRLLPRGKPVSRSKPVLGTRPAFRYEFAGPGSRFGAILTNPPVLGMRPASITLAPALAGALSGWTGSIAQNAPALTTGLTPDRRKRKRCLRQPVRGLGPARSLVNAGRHVRTG
jgi:hypothetical protein